MVVKLFDNIGGVGCEFESCVVLDGSQTIADPNNKSTKFESCVVLDGSQTLLKRKLDCLLFESCVVLDGSQTGQICGH